MFKRKILSTRDGHDNIDHGDKEGHGLEDINHDDQFGIVIIPENGAPCGDLIRTYNGGSRDLETETVLTEVLHVS